MTINRKAQVDVTHCLVCGFHFGSDDVREDVMKGEVIVGTVHLRCQGDPRIEEAISRSRDRNYTPTTHV